MGGRGLRLGPNSVKGHRFLAPDLCYSKRSLRTSSISTTGELVGNAEALGHTTDQWNQWFPSDSVHSKPLPPLSRAVDRRRVGGKTGCCSHWYLDVGSDCGLFKMEIPSPTPRASPSEVSGGPTLLLQVPPNVWDHGAHWERGRVGKAGVGIKDKTRVYSREKATEMPVLTRNLCICTCIPMINLKILEGKEYIFSLIRLSVTLNLPGKPHILEEVPTEHRCPRSSLLLKEPRSD